MMRHHIPFGTFWGMRIEVPYSCYIETAGFGWSCGQCPLDFDGQVLNPGDLVAQSERVAETLRDIIAGAGEPAQTTIDKLVLYHDPASPDEHAEMLACFRRRFGPAVALVPVPVPYFYYEGMRLEVDLYASRLGSPDLRNRGFDFDLAAGDLRTALTQWMTHTACSADRVLAAHWFAPASEIDRISETLGALGLAPDPGGVVGIPGTRLYGSVTQSYAGPIYACQEAFDGVSVHLRRAPGGWLWFAGRALSSGPAGLLDQTESIMTRFEAVLTQQGGSFTDAVKQTTHYIGNPTAEDLHSNMAIRNRRYAGISPGPASTGLPVHRLADPASSTAVDILFKVEDQAA